jgi:hypothetical protein
VQDKLIEFVDDFILTGKTDFRKEVTDATRAVFGIKKNDASSFQFAGLDVDKSTPTRTLSQASYIKTIDNLSTTTDFDDFKSKRAQLQWIVSTRPDISFAASAAMRVTADIHSSADIKMMNETLGHLRETPFYSLKFPPLDQRTRRLLVYCDGNFANTDELSSQIAHIVVLADATGTCSILHYRSNKSKRDVRSSMASETLVFIDGFDQANLIRHDLEQALGHEIPLSMLTDSQPLFDVLTKKKITTEKRLMIDLAATREAYAHRIITNIGLIKSEYNVADGMTKLHSNNALAQQLRTARISHPVEQYIIHERVDEH